MYNNFRSEDDRYNDIRKVTVEMIGQDRFDKYYKETGKRWLDIARVWDKIKNSKYHRLLIYTVHAIIWGMYPKHPYGESFDKLLELVKEEILRDGEAFKAWGSWRTFKNVVSEEVNASGPLVLAELDMHFIEHHQYLTNKAMYDIFYSKSSFGGHKECEDAIRSYEKAVKLLAPDSVNWNRTQWGNDLVLAEAIKQRYGVDYSLTDDSQRDFERIIMMIKSLGNKNKWMETIWYASNIIELPWDIVKLIWPKKTEKILVDMLIEAHEISCDYEAAGKPFEYKVGNWIHPVFHYNKAALKNSWLKKHVSDIYNNGKFAGKKRDDLRKVLFDLEITC